VLGDSKEGMMNEKVLSFVGESGVVYLEYDMILIGIKYVFYSKK